MIKRHHNLVRFGGGGCCVVVAEVPVNWLRRWDGTAFFGQKAAECLARVVRKRSLKLSCYGVRIFD